MKNNIVNYTIDITNIFKKNLLVKNTDLYSIKYGDGKWDSLKHLQLILDCENKFKIKFSNKEIIKLTSFSDFLDYFENKV